MADLHPIVASFLLSRRIENCSPASIHTYADRITGMLKLIGKAPEDVTKTDVEFWLLHLRESESKRGGRRSPFFIRSSFGSVRVFFNWMVAEGHIARSPLAGIKVPKVPRYEKDFLSEEDFRRLLDLCPRGTFVGLRDRAWLWLLWSTGARFSELYNLRLEDLDWSAARIRVIGKGSKERRVPFSVEAQRAVYHYLQRRDDKLAELWLSDERRPLKALGMRVVVPRLMAAASPYECPACGTRHEGLSCECREYLCPACGGRLTRLWHVQDCHHIFRRSWAWRNLKAGTSTKLVQLVGGWDSVTVLEQYVRRMTADDALSGDVKWR